MWEFCLKMREENSSSGEVLYLKIKEFAVMLGGICTKDEDDDFLSILMGVPEQHRAEAEGILSYLISQFICVQYKAEFLEQNLSLPIRDNMSKVAFKEALLQFDRETDYFLIKKKLDFSTDLYLESFFAFRLKPLKAKWEELVALVCDNRDYLSSREAFFDLLRFLVDNLDMGEEELSVFEENGKYKLSLSGEEDCILADEGLLSRLIQLSPQKINFYAEADSPILSFLRKIFEKRIKVRLKMKQRS